MKLAWISLSTCCGTCDKCDCTQILFKRLVRFLMDVRRKLEYQNCRQRWRLSQTLWMVECEQFEHTPSFLSLWRPHRHSISSLLCPHACQSSPATDHVSTKPASMETTIWEHKDLSCSRVPAVDRDDAAARTDMRGMLTVSGVVVGLGGPSWKKMRLKQVFDLL